MIIPKEARDVFQIKAGDTLMFWETKRGGSL
ncbi:MAG: hypothetical protein ACLRV9_08615 [Clostridium sp.]